MHRVFMYPILWTFLFLCTALVAAILEVLLPSGGLFAILALACLITSLVFSFQASILFGSLYTLFVCLLVPVFIWAALRVWPHTWIGRRILLAPEDDPALVPSEEQESLKQLVGKHGIARSKMLLGGLIEIDGNRYGAVSDAEPIELGEPLCVIRIEGTSIIVRKLDSMESIVPLTHHSPLEDPFAV